ncbi:MAG: hypothetical protein G01um10145_628 [Microgenomates group bacterium Gr01-1014_5]|nr:MAG: hypothetical protein G01um10145_628 [Microgenomates group bacterium Gr01-1014_5]
MQPSKQKINLLQQDLVVATRFRHLGKISLITTGVYVFIVMGLFSVLFLTSRQKNSLETLAAGLTRDVQSLKETEGLLVTLKNRLGLSKLILGAAAPTPSEFIEKQIKSLPEGVEVTSFKAQEDGTITLSLRAQNSLSIIKFINTLKEQNPVTVVLNSLIQLEDGTYSLSVNVK